LQPRRRALVKIKDLKKKKKGPGGKKFWPRGRVVDYGILLVLRKFAMGTREGGRRGERGGKINIDGNHR